MVQPDLSLFLNIITVYSKNKLTKNHHLLRSRKLYLTIRAPCSLLGKLLPAETSAGFVACDGMSFSSLSLAACQQHMHTASIECHKTLWQQNICPRHHLVTYLHEILKKYYATTKMNATDQICPICGQETKVYM